MKNSNKWLLAALLVLLTTLTAYNMALRTEYRKGDYKDPLHGYAKLDFKDFTEVETPTFNGMAVTVVSGPFGVHLSPRAAEYVHLRQQGGRLVVSASFPDKREFMGFAETVVISCPRLAALRTDGVYQAAGKSQAENEDGGRVLIKGFRQDSLALTQARGGHVVLAGNHLAMLRAVAGTHAGSHPYLDIKDDNQLAAATLALNHQSELTIDNVVIPQLHWHFSDSTHTTLTGRALGNVAR